MITSTDTPDKSSISWVGNGDICKKSFLIITSQYPTILYVEQQQETRSSIFTVYKKIFTNIFHFLVFFVLSSYILDISKEMSNEFLIIIE